MKQWLVEQRAQIGGKDGPIVPVRSVADGKTKKDAAKIAPAAIRAAVEVLTAGREMQTELLGEPVVLYAV